MGNPTGHRQRSRYPSLMGGGDLQAKERGILQLLTGLCVASERDELRIAELLARLNAFGAGFRAGLTNEQRGMEMD